MIPKISIQTLKQAFNWATSLYYNPTSSKQQEPQTLNLKQMSIPVRVQCLKKQLKFCCYEQQLYERICMYYSSIADKFPKFLFTKSQPQQHNVLNTNQKVQKTLIQQQKKNQKVQQKEKQKQKTLISFYGQIWIKIGNVNCPLFLTILIPKNFMNQLPIFYIRNPQSNTNHPSKPNQKYCFVVPREKKISQSKLKEIKSRYSYQAVLGGIRVKIPKKSQDSRHEWKWTKQQYYKSSNIVKMIQWTIQKLKTQFPFVKKKKNQLQNLQNQQEYNVSMLSFKKGMRLLSALRKSQQVQQQQTKNLKKEEPLRFALQNIQKLDVFQKSIKSEQRYLQNENYKMKKYIQTTEKYFQVNSPSQFYPKPAQNQSDQLLNAICEYEAIKDCLNEFDHYVQKSFQEKLQSKMISRFQTKIQTVRINQIEISSFSTNSNKLTLEELQTQMVTFKYLSGQLFQKRYNLKRLTQRYNLLQNKIKE